MSCEETWKEFTKAPKDWVRVSEELRERIQSLTPGQPTGPIIALMDERDAACQRHRAGLVGYIEASKRHHD